MPFLRVEQTVRVSMPISERVFAGGGKRSAVSILKVAGPRVVMVSQRIFRNSNGEPVFLDPFTIPFGVKRARL